VSSSVRAKVKLKRNWKETKKADNATWYVSVSPLSSYTHTHTQTLPASKSVWLYAFMSNPKPSETHVQCHKHTYHDSCHKPPETHVQCHKHTSHDSCHDSRLDSCTQPNWPNNPPATNANTRDKSDITRDMALDLTRDMTHDMTHAPNNLTHQYNCTQW